MQNVPFCDPKSGPGTHADDSKSSAICGCSRDPAGKKLTARGTQKVENRVAKVCQAETIIGHFNPTRPCYSSLPSQIFHPPDDGGVPSNVPPTQWPQMPPWRHLDAHKNHRNRQNYLTQKSVQKMEIEGISKNVAVFPPDNASIICIVMLEISIIILMTFAARWVVGARFAILFQYCLDIFCLLPYCFNEPGRDKFRRTERPILGATGATFFFRYASMNRAEINSAD